MERNEIKRKVKELFNYRHIPFLLKAGGLNENEEFIEDLYELQIKIYFLDQVLESDWEVDEKELENKWKGIVEQLQKMGYSYNESILLVSNIKVYERHELNMRLDKWPTFYTFKYLYYYKSCDVKLLRKLIYQRAPEIGKLVSERHWRFFDLITEVNDDVEDVFEDLDTINGNRFLISILKHGIKKTIDEYHSFLNQIEGQFNAFFPPVIKKSQVQYVYDCTMAELEATRKLLNNRLSRVKQQDLATAKLSSYLQPELA